MAAERREEQRVLDRDVRVEVQVEVVARDVELPAQLELHGAQPPIDLVGGHPHLLVVIGLRDGVAPVDDERCVVVVGHAGGTDVDVACGSSRAHPEAHLGKVGLPQQYGHASQALDVEVMHLVVGVYDGVQGLDGRQGLHGLVGAAEVLAHLLGHVDQVPGGLPVGGLEPLGELVAQTDELRVDVVEVCLLCCQRPVVHARDTPPRWRGGARLFPGRSRTR